MPIGLTDDERIILVLAREYHISPLELVNYPMSTIKAMIEFQYELKQEREFEEFKAKQKAKLRGLRGLA